MKNWIKSNHYEFDITDITTLITIIAVILTIVGFGFIATIIFILNCLFGLVVVIKFTKRFNLLALQLALLALNIFFLIA